ncbi:MAG TPA: ring-cleaving dioxygenase [Candidatus Dormibacteraeota bacterium]|jgi:glyoxalase family protein
MKPLGGLHHVTAITGDAPLNLAFYTKTLGMRLVKKTVNQDDVSAYHLFYADAKGSPGTDVTFFDWPNTPPNRPGAGSIAPIALRVGDRAALEWWLARFDAVGVTHGEIGERNDRAYLPFADPEGQQLELVADGGASGGVAWPASPVPAAHQVKGLHGVTLTSLRPQATVDVLVGAMGFRATGERELPSGGVEHFFEVGPGGPGAEVILSVPTQVGPAQQGRGGVHHVAFRVPDDETHSSWREHIAGAGLRPTPVIDRFYFKSIYFREPGGVLFEIATDGPGFAADEPEEHLGEHLALPPFLEPDRERIEAGLIPLGLPVP